MSPLATLLPSSFVHAQTLNLQAQFTSQKSWVSTLHKLVQYCTLVTAKIGSGNSKLPETPKGTLITTGHNFVSSCFESHVTQTLAKPLSHYRPTGQLNHTLVKPLNHFRPTGQLKHIINFIRQSLGQDIYGVDLAQPMYSQLGSNVTQLRYI